MAPIVSGREEEFFENKTTNELRFFLGITIEEKEKARHTGFGEAMPHVSLS